MTAASKAAAITRWGAVFLMATAVLTATAGGFAQSYAGLYQWALEHGLHGWKAGSFPLLVDLFIVVGELGLFLLAIDAFVLKRRHLLSWLDFMLPLFIALAGWTASLIFNVGHVVQREFSYQATAAVPPIVSMLGLFVLLRTLHRYVSTEEQANDEAAQAPAAEEQRALPGPVTLQHITVVPLRINAQPPALPAAPARPAVRSASAKTADEPSVPAPRRVAPKPAPAPAPEPVSVGSMAEANGHSTVTTWSDPTETISQPDPETLRALVRDVLSRHNGDIPATVAELAADGYIVDIADVRKMRENHWFPYAVYRLLARNLGDLDAVKKALREQGIDYDPESLEALARNWHG
jgi:hypothetical protein